MAYLILWLFLGCIGYMLAITVQLEKLAARVACLEKDNKKKIWNTNVDYARGLTLILFGPLAICLVFFLNNYERKL